jgi:hypothetical protein
MMLQTLDETIKAPNGSAPVRGLLHFSVLVDGEAIGGDADESVGGLRVA